MTGRFISNREGREKYQEALTGDADSLPYQEPEWLDIVAPGWLLWEFEGCYFPVATKKFGPITLVQQPVLSPRFKIVGPKQNAQSILSVLLQDLERIAAFVDICIDQSEIETFGSWKQESRPTYIFRVPDNSEALFSAYHSNHKRILKKGTELHLHQFSDIDKFLNTLQKGLSTKTKLPSSFFRAARQLQYCKSFSWDLWAAEHKCNPLAVCGILSYRGKLFYQLASGLPASRDFQAMHHLVHKVLESAKDKEFDFEGSVIPGLQRFYSGFGAKPYIYTRVSYNRLPWPLTLWKYGIRSK